MCQDIKVLIVDGHPIVRQVLKMQIELAQGFSVITDTDTILETTTLITELKPDVILINTDMPGIDGISTTGELHQSFPQIPIPILALSEEDEDTCLQAYNAGAAGFIKKDVNPT